MHLIYTNSRSQFSIIHLKCTAFILQLYVLLEFCRFFFIIPKYEINREKEDKKNDQIAYALLIGLCKF